jgi:hypothetical protein
MVISIKLTELAMCQLSAELRMKEEWWMHFRHWDTRTEWANEAYERVFKVRTPSNVLDVRLSRQQARMACRHSKHAN